MKKQKGRGCFDQHIETRLGVIVLVIIAITVSVLTWQIVKNREVAEVPQNVAVQSSSVEKNNQNQTQAQQQKKLTPEEVGKNSENISTSDWKLYTNKKDGYFIKYPTTWISNSGAGTDEAGDASFYIKESKEREPDMSKINGDYFINISVYKGMGTHVNLKEWRKYDGNNYQEVLINGNATLKFGADSQMPNVRRYYFIRSNNDGYEITVRYNNNIDNMGDKIISTLKFID